MDNQTARELLKRIKTLENEMVRLRRGVVTDDSPLSVALGGSDIAYEDVPALDGVALDVDDPVTVLMRGNDLLVLGALGRPMVTGTGLISTSASVGQTTFTHGLGRVPKIVLAQISDGTNRVVITAVAAYTTTQATAHCRLLSGAEVTNANFRWVAVA